MALTDLFQQATFPKKEQTLRPVLNISVPSCKNFERVSKWGIPIFLSSRAKRKISIASSGCHEILCFALDTLLSGCPPNRLSSSSSGSEFYGHRLGFPVRILFKLLPHLLEKETIVEKLYLKFIHNQRIPQFKHFIRKLDILNLQIYTSL